MGMGVIERIPIITRDINRDIEHLDIDLDKLGSLNCPEFMDEYLKLRIYMQCYLYCSKKLIEENIEDIIARLDEMKKIIKIVPLIGSKRIN